MIKVVVSGNTDRTESFLTKMLNLDIASKVQRAADAGVDALRSATPRESGLTAESWTCEVENKSDSVIIWWKNTNIVNGFNVAVGLQYGHGTGTGGWVAGYDYINPALRPVFDSIAENMWKEVQRS